MDAMDLLVGIFGPVIIESAAEAVDEAAETAWWADIEQQDEAWAAAEELHLQRHGL